MFTTIRYVLLTALRDKLFVILLLATLVAAFVSSALAGTSLIEQHEMTLVFTAATSRLILVVGLIVFACFHVRQAFDSKEIDVMLSRPISRAELVFAYWLSFALIGAIMALPAIAVIGFISPNDIQGFVHWSISIMLELWVMAAVALFAGLMLKSAVTSVMSSLAFYILARMMGFFIATVQSGMLFEEKTINVMTKHFIEKVAIIIPRLDFYAESDWLIYGAKFSISDALLYAGQSVIFIPLLLLAAIVDFKKRQF